jgi:hypothetical protein
VSACQLLAACQPAANHALRFLTSVEVIPHSLAVAGHPAWASPGHTWPVRFTTDFFPVHLEVAAGAVLLRLKSLVVCMYVNPCHSSDSSEDNQGENGQGSLVAPSLTSSPAGGGARGKRNRRGRVLWGPRACHTWCKLSAAVTCRPSPRSTDYFLAQTHLSVPLFLSFTFTPAAYVSFWGHYGLAFVLEFAYLH